jgi:hypothetical protein
MTLKGRFALILPLCLVVGFGCEKNPNAPSTVSGKVTYKGAPVPGGDITFTPEKQGPPYSRPLGPDGSFSLTDVPAGKYDVTIETESINPDHKQPAYRKPGGGAAAGGPPIGPIPAGANVPTAKYVKIPAKYANVKTSGLTATIGDNKPKEFDLTD